MNGEYEKIIKECYRTVLRREYDENGLQHFLNMMKKDEITKDQLISLMMNSEEYKDIEFMNNFIKKYDLLFTKNQTMKRLQDLSKIGDCEKLNVNFFWHGEDFGFLNNIVVKSHIKVGHTPKIWISGRKPSNRYWKDIESRVTVIDFSEYFDVDEFLSFGGSIHSASDLWRFHFLYACGGLYSDMDNFALKHFPDDDWLILSGEPKVINIGIIKCLANSSIFIESMKNLKIHWGGVQVFTDAYIKKFGNMNSTHNGNLFYPYLWTDSLKLFEKTKIPNNAYAIHFYQSNLQHHLGKQYKNINEKWCENNPNALLGQLWLWLNSN